jgi:hypothetical protein
MGGIAAGTSVSASGSLASVFHLTHDSQMAANQPVAGQYPGIVKTTLDGFDQREYLEGRSKKCVNRRCNYSVSSSVPANNKPDTRPADDRRSWCA